MILEICKYDRSFICLCIFILGLATGCNLGTRSPESPNAPERENASSSAEAATQAAGSSGGATTVPGDTSASAGVDEGKDVQASDGTNENTPASSQADVDEDQASQASVEEANANTPASSQADQEAAYLVAVHAKIESLCNDPALNKLNDIIHIRQEITDREATSNTLLQLIKKKRNQPTKNIAPRLQTMRNNLLASIEQVQSSIDKVKSGYLDGSVVIEPQWLQQQREKLQKGLQEISTAVEQQLKEIQTGPRLQEIVKALNQLEQNEEKQQEPNPAVTSATDGTIAPPHSYLNYIANLEEIEEIEEGIEPICTRST